MELPTHDQLDKLFLKAGTQCTLDGVHCVFTRFADGLGAFLESEFGSDRNFEYAGPTCWACPRVAQREAAKVRSYQGSNICSPCHALPATLTIVPFVVWQRFQLLKE